MVNLLTRRSDEDALSKSKEELDKAKKKLETAVADLRDARNRAGILDVQVTAKYYIDILTKLRLDLANVQIDMQQLTINRASNSPQFNVLKAQEVAMKEQIKRYEGLVAQSSNVTGETSLATLATSLKEQEIQASVAQTNYTTSVTDYERARLNLERKRAYLVTYVTPQLPEESLYPRRALTTMIVALAGTLLWAIAAGFGMVVRDHFAA
jgi:capsular polysaccharide transport system permease protein